MTLVSIRRAIKEYLDAPADETILGRALIRENRLGLIVNRVGSAIYYIVSRGGLIACGGGIAVFAFVVGSRMGHNDGFRDGCIAAAGRALLMCEYTETLAQRIRIEVAPGRPLTDNQKTVLATICGEYRHSLPDGLLRHAGCLEDNTP